MADCDQSVYQTLRAHFPPMWKPIQCSKATLIDFSHAVEDMFISHQLSGMLFTGFQESKYWRREIARYKHLTQIAQQVCVFAGRPLPDDSPYGEVRITLPEASPLRQEWFVIGLTDHFSILLAGLDLQEPVTHEARRRFDTLWTFDPEIIQHCVEALLRLIEKQRPEKHEQIHQAVLRFPPRPPDTLYSSLLIHKFLSHLEQQHQIILDNLENLDSLVQRRTQELALEHETTRRILQQLSSAVIVLDDTGNVVEMNDAGQLLLDGAWDETGQHMRTLREVLRASVSEPIYQRELTVGDLTLMLSTAKVTSETDRPLTVAVLQDLTHYYTLDRVRHKFLDAISHQLRSPLSVIKMQLYLAERDVENISRHLRALREAEQKLEAIVNNLLNITEVDLASLSYLAVYAAQFAEQLESQIALQPWAHRIKVSVDLPTRAVIQADPSRLVFCILDLLDSVLERLDEASSLLLDISVHSSENSLLWLEMRIDRASPPPSHHELAAAGSNHVARIGLARRIIEQHGGTLDMVNVGVPVVVRIPITAEDY